jgi:ribonuclease HI
VADNLTVQEVLDKYPNGPSNGIFCDGGCSPNPGQGGWGVVHVRHNKVVNHLWGYDPETTNNKMELIALINAFKMAPINKKVIIFSDSQYCVRILNEWAESWEKNAWSKKNEGIIKNLQQIKTAWYLKQFKPNVIVKWTKGHEGNRWNEYANSLAHAWSRDTL